MICQDILHWQLQKRTDLERGYTVLLAFTGMAHFLFLKTLHLIVQRYTPEHPAIKQTCDSLLRLLYELPTEGPWYSSIHPAWCFVIACICVQREEDLDILVNYLDRIAGDNKSVSFKQWYMDAVNISENVDDCCSLVRRTQQWQRQEWENRDVQSQDPGWWERMAGNVDGEFVICLA